MFSARAKIPAYKCDLQYCLSGAGTTLSPLPFQQGIYWTPVPNSPESVERAQNESPRYAARSQMPYLKRSVWDRSFVRSLCNWSNWTPTLFGSASAGGYKETQLQSALSNSAGRHLFIAGDQLGRYCFTGDRNRHITNMSYN